MRKSLALIVLSSALVPSAAFAADTTTSNQSVRISTGVVAPALLNASALSIPSDALSEVLSPSPAVVVDIQLDAKGETQDVHVVKSVNAKLDEKVVSLAHEFRFRPATLDNQPVPFNLEMTVNVQR